MMDAEILKSAGIDYEAGLARFMGDAELYELVLSTFARDDMAERAAAAFERRDMKALMACVHEAKGASGNADLTGVYAEACALVTLLRSGDYTEAQLTRGYERFAAAYQTMQEAIRSALEV